MQQDTTMLGPVFILVGLSLFAGWYFLRNKAKATGQWLTARGRVVASNVNRYRDTDGEYQEELRVTYDYAVAGTILRGNRISTSGSGSGTAKAKLARYQPGAEVDVFYDPQNPVAAVLERKLPGNVVVLPIVGTVFLIVGACALVIR
jgi:hypothetical protein